MTYSRGKILLVDDDPAILLTVGDQLQFNGYEVVKASTAEQALNQLPRVSPDLIILDISMPGMGGMGFMRDISESTGKLKYPVLVFTARGELHDFFAGLGIEGFLAKTIDPDTLLKEVSRIIDKNFCSPSETLDGARRHRILLAEDDEDVRNELLNLLQRHGHETWGVGSGFSILEAVFTHRPSVVVLKYILPHMNGPVSAQMLAGMPSTRDISVILYDGSGIHSPKTTFPHVRAFVPTSEGIALLKVIQQMA
jgi:CheY-like chemotaxis protein